jgi:hypothetical protein
MSIGIADDADTGAEAGAPAGADSVIEFGENVPSQVGRGAKIGGLAGTIAPPSDPPPDDGGSPCSAAATG